MPAGRGVKAASRRGRTSAGGDTEDEVAMASWQGIFIDFYGTLVGGDRHAVESICRRVIADHGGGEDRAGITAEAFAVRWGQAYFDALEHVNGSGFRTLHEIERDTLVQTCLPLFGPIDPTPYIEAFDRYLAAPPLFEEVPEVLAALRLPVCIVSNADERELLAAMEHNRLRAAAVVTSEAARSYKPDRRIFERALEVTGWSRERVLHVGDSLHSDVAGAHAAGLRAAWVDRAHRIHDIGSDTPDFQWPDLRPLAEL